MKQLSSATATQASDLTARRAVATTAPLPHPQGRQIGAATAFAKALNLQVAAEDATPMASVPAKDPSSAIEDADVAASLVLVGMPTPQLRPSPELIRPSEDGRAKSTDSETDSETGNKTDDATAATMPKDRSADTDARPQQGANPVANPVASLDTSSLVATAVAVTALTPPVAAAVASQSPSTALDQHQPKDPAQSPENELREVGKSPVKEVKAASSDASPVDSTATAAAPKDAATAKEQPDQESPGNAATPPLPRHEAAKHPPRQATIKMAAAEMAAATIATSSKTARTESLAIAPASSARAAPSYDQARVVSASPCSEAVQGVVATPVHQTAAPATVASGSTDTSDIAASPAEPARWLASMVEQRLLRLMTLDTTQGHARMELQHPQLGRTLLELRLTGGTLEVYAEASTLNAAAVLRASESKLRDQVERHGLQLRRLQVSTRRQAAADRADERRTHPMTNSVKGKL